MSEYTPVKNAFNQLSVKLFFGHTEVEVREMPLARTRKFVPLIGGVIEDYNKAMKEAEELVEEGGTFNNLDQFQVLADIVFERPYPVLSILIPDLPEEPFVDEDNGVTIPQLLDAFEVVLTINRLEWLKKSIPFFQTLIQNTDLTELLDDVSMRTGFSRESSQEPPSESQTP